MITDAGDAVGDHDARQAGATIEHSIAEGRHTVGDRDGCQAFAACEGIIPDAGELTVFPESDARQAGAPTEGIIPETGDPVGGS